MNTHSFSGAGASRREVLLGGIGGTIATLAPGVLDAGAFSQCPSDKRRFLPGGGQ